MVSTRQLGLPSASGPDSVMATSQDQSFRNQHSTSDHPPGKLAQRHLIAVISHFQRLCAVVQAMVPALLGPPRWVGAAVTLEPGTQRYSGEKPAGANSP